MKSMWICILPVVLLSCSQGEEDNSAGPLEIGVPESSQWEKVQVGQSREAVIEILGEPRAKGTLPDGSYSLMYYASKPVVVDLLTKEVYTAPTSESPGPERVMYGVLFDKDDRVTTKIAMPIDAEPDINLEEDEGTSPGMATP